MNSLLIFTGMALALILMKVAEGLKFRWSRNRRLELLEEAKDEAEHIKNQAQLDVEIESETLQKSIARLAERENAFQKREEMLHRQLESLSDREGAFLIQRKSVEEKEAALLENARRAKELEAEWQRRISSTAGLSREEAKAELVRLIEAECRHEAEIISHRIVEKARHESEEQARKIISLAIGRCAGNHTSETTTAAVALKGDDIKGRIIGREGRNIRAFENATGMTVLIDDTPNAVVLSGFDPVRREIARESMDRLISDGRIHPTRIEEVVEKVKVEIEDRILKVAKEAVLKLGLAPVHEEVAKRLGRLHFRLSYSQNVLDHSVEVARLSALMAAELNVNVVDATRSGLLHDLGKALGDEMGGSHARAGAEFIRRYGENATVVNAVASHHDEVEHEGVLGILIGAADAISAARPGARSEPVAAYINRLRNLEELGMSFRGVERCFAAQAGREIRVFVRPKEVSDDEAKGLAKAICRKIEDELHYPGQIRVSVIRELRCVEYAK